MAYQVLARKWRPQDFDSVVGQEPVVTALRNALADGRVAQAYLFSGIRGVGKTSVARVFAKALNCQVDPPSDPCNECTSCTEITAGSNLDMLEIDAATYSKVEQVRELTESLQYGPARNPRKVVIIDEIHRLSRQAFDALLKIVEEPPEHLVFIFATTEIEAVPATILSRCQSFQFGRVPLAEMVAHLNRISEAEGLGASDHALRLISRAGEGSVRDSVALLDQVATFGGGTVDDEEVGRILGGVDFALFQNLLHAILAGDRNEVSAAARRVEAEGWDPRHVYGEFLTYCRDALHLVLDPKHAGVELPAEEATALAREAGSAGYENLLRLLNLLLESEQSVRRSESASLALEITLLRAAELPKLVAIEEFLAGTPGGDEGDDESEEDSGGSSASSDSSGQMAAPAATSAAETKSASTTESEPAQAEPSPEPPVREEPARGKPVEAARETTARDEPVEEVKGEATEEASLSEPDDDASVVEAETGPDAETRVDAEPQADTEPETPAEAQPAEPQPAGEPELEPVHATASEPEAAPAADPPKPPAGSSAAVAQLLERLSYLKQPLAAHLSGAESLSMADGVLTIATAPGDPVLEKTLKRPGNKELLDQALAELVGTEGQWRLVPGNGRVEEVVETPDEDPDPDVTQDPTVQKVLDLFGGQIESVDRRPSPDQ
jgi:DNA polymerase-3 subunit gamma/tau